MKFSHLLSLLCILPALPLCAQDPEASNGAGPGPLQIQEPPAPGTMPAPTSFAPEPSTPAQAVPDAAAPEPADAAAPATSTLDPLAPTPDSGMGSPGQNPPASDPNSLIPPPAEPEQPSPINASGNEEKQRQEQKARYYSVKVKADKEEALASLQQKAEKAKSDEVKRQALREYYDLLAKRMKKLDPSLSEWIDTMHAAYLRRLAQLRVEPTIPLNPPPVPDDSVAPSPPPKKKTAKADEDDAPAKKGKATPSPSPSPEKKSDKKQDKKNG